MMFGRWMRNGAVRIDKECVVIVAAMEESSEMLGESSSRSDLSILDAQNNPLKALKATVKHIELLNFTGRAT